MCINMHLCVFNKLTYNHIYIYKYLQRIGILLAPFWHHIYSFQCLGPRLYPIPSGRGPQKWFSGMGSLISTSGEAEPAEHQDLVAGQHLGCMETYIFFMGFHGILISISHYLMEINGRLIIKWRFHGIS